MAPQKGKVATKGAKQIVEENAATLVFYRNMGMGASVIYLLVMFAFFYDSFTTSIIALLILTTIIHLVCFNLLRYAAKTTYSESGQLLDSGTDLNMEGGIAEHVKDLIILTSGTQLLSLTTNYFWLLMLLAPVRAVFMLWRSVLAPWFFQEGPPQPDMDEKKQKKMEKRRMIKN